MSIKFNFLNKKYLDLYLIFFSTIIFFLPLNFFGLTQLEEYESGIYSAYLIFNKFHLSDYFLTFSGLISSGTHIPLGQGLFFFPSSFLIFNFKVFYFVTILINLFIQFYYFKKIIYLISNKKNHIFPFIFLFNLPNFSYLHFSDWISCFTTFSLFIPIIYYSLKFQKKNYSTDLIKIVFFLSIIILNGHLGFSIYIIYFLILFFLINLNFSYFKNKFFYLSIFILLAVISERLFDIITMYFYSLDAPNYKHDNYALNDYIYGITKVYYTFINIIEKIFNVENIYNSKQINGREVVYGISFLISFAYSIFILIKKKSNTFFHLNIIFLLFVMISFLNYNWLPKLSGTWQSRDIIYLLGFLLISIFLLKIKKKYYYILLSLLIINNLFLITESIYHIKTYGKFNINNISKTDSNFFKNINTDNGKFQRIYLSPKTFYEINNQSNSFFIENNIYSFNDFIKFNLYPINYIIKNQKNALRDINFKMYTIVNSNFSEINNKNFLDFLLIDFILIKEEELDFIDKDLFLIKKTIKTNSDTFILLEKRNKKYLLINQNFDNSKIASDCKNSSNKILCFLKKDIYDKNDKLYFKKISHNTFIIENKNSYDVNFILPFTNVGSLIKNDVYINKLNNNFTSVFIKANSSSKILIENNLKKKLRIISHLSLVILLIVIIFSKKLKINK